MDDEGYNMNHSGHFKPIEEYQECEDFRKDTGNEYCEEWIDNEDTQELSNSLII